MSKEALELLLKVMPLVLVGITVGFFIIELIDIQRIKKLNKKALILRKKALLRGIPISKSFTPIKLNKLSLIISAIFTIVTLSQIPLLDKYPLIKYLKVEFAEFIQNLATSFLHMTS